jgi:hypothetical protein
MSSPEQDALRLNDQSREGNQTEEVSRKLLDDVQKSDKVQQVAKAGDSTFKVDDVSGEMGDHYKALVASLESAANKFASLPPEYKSAVVEGATGVIAGPIMAFLVDKDKGQEFFNLVSRAVKSA